MDIKGTEPVRLLGVVEAAKILGIGRKTLYAYTKKGLVKADRRLPSGIYRYHPDEIKRFSQSLTKPEKGSRKG